MTLFDTPEPPAHEAVYLDILRRHGMDRADIPIPLQGRYTRPRRWTDSELEWAYEAWLAGETFHLITSTLNRNPQDIIFKLLELCKQRGVTFTEAGRNVDTAGWTNEVEACATELFAAGLPAWKIAILFEVNFEHVEKRLYAARSDYGHKKLNPFGVCTDQKRELNQLFAQQLGHEATDILDGFAGEGIGTMQYAEAFPASTVTAVEQDAETFLRLKEVTASYPNIDVVQDSIRSVLLRRIVERPGARFDLVDLDPFVTCWDVLDPAIEMLKPGGLLFVTFGGEYRRCFVGSNRLALARRYRLRLGHLDNAAMLEEAPRYMLGEVAEKAAMRGLLIEPLLVVRYPMIVRAYLRLRKPRSVAALFEGLNERVQRSEFGSRYDVTIPKWKSVDPNRGPDQLLSVDPVEHSPRRRL